MKPGRPDRFGSGPAGVALAYVGASWVLIQVVESFDQLLDGLPDSLIRGALVLLLVGFPIVVTTAWVQQRSGRARVTASGALGFFTWRNAALGGVGALALWGVVAAVWLAAFGGAATRSDPDADDTRVLAVLPFDNLLSDGGEQGWLVAGLHEQVIHELAALPDLRVISRTSVLPYGDTELSVPEIGERLGAELVLEGSVRGDGERIRTTLQLIDVASDQHEWSREYDAPMGDLLEVQSMVAGRVAQAFGSATGTEARARSRSRGPSTDDPEALQAYWRGRYLWQNVGAPPGEQTTALFRRAVEIDPDFALAWAALAEAWLNSAHVGTPPDVAFPRADSMAVQALARDPDLAEAHVALADTRFHYDWNWEGAERGFRRGLELNPSHATGHWFYAGLLAALGRGDEAAAQLERARAVEPLAAMTDAFGARVLYWDRRFDEAEATARRALELNSSHFYALGAIGFIHLGKGEAAEAVDAFRRSVEMSPKFRSGLAMALARAGREEEAREIVDRLEVEAAEAYLSPYERAFGHVGLGDHDRALALLEEATRTRDAELIWIAVEPAFDPLRDEPRFQAILREMGLAGVGASAVAAAP